jgi:hypothetical protein
MKKIFFLLKVFAATLAWIVFFVSAIQINCQSATAGPDTRVPIIYSTDLFHPPDDPDDDVDLVTLFALQELDVRAIILDLGHHQSAKPGEIPLKQIMRLTGRQVPFATGLLQPLKYPSDKALADPSPAAVELILTVLRDAGDKVVIVITGSARDVMAAFNRDEKLFREKVAHIYFNGGNSGGGDLHWNPGLDPQAYIRLMTADLPVYWCPTFSGSATRQMFYDGKLETLQSQTYWKFVQRDVYDALAKPLQNFFLYALGGKNSAIEDPLAYLEQEPEPPLQKRVWNEARNMWSTASLYHAAGRELYRRGDSWAILGTPQQGFERTPLYEFVPATVTIDRDLRSTLKVGQSRGQFMVFHLIDLQNYQRAMTVSLRNLLAEMPLQTGEKK